MSSFQQAFKDVSKLVSDFKDNESYFLSPQYQEVEARRDFIDRLFMALGWDVKHDEQKNPYEQEVKVETIVQIAHAQKRADYSFYLAPDFHTVKFFVKAKKQLHQTKTEGYKNYLQRKCKRLDKETDQLVYKL